MKLGNSNNHNKEGQNVLYGDGSVRFVETPFEGAQRDNIYTIQDNTVTIGTIPRTFPEQSGRFFEPSGFVYPTSSPGGKGDTFLLPHDDAVDVDGNQVTGTP